MRTSDNYMIGPKFHGLESAVDNGSAHRSPEPRNYQNTKIWRVFPRNDLLKNLTATTTVP